MFSMRNREHCNHNITFSYERVITIEPATILKEISVNRFRAWEDLKAVSRPRTIEQDRNLTNL